MRRAAVVLVAAVLVAALLLDVLLAAGCSGPSPPAGPQVEAVPTESPVHVAEGSAVRYASLPPASGMHYPRWLRPGLYREEISPGYWVHNLEHGYVVVVYNCPEGCPRLVSELEQLLERAPHSRYGYPKLIILPYGEMDARLAALAWGRRLFLEEADVELLLDFYRQHVDRGPEDAP